MYQVKVQPRVDKVFFKLSKKNPKILKNIQKKINDIKNNPEKEYKFLQHELSGFNRVHIEQHFVLIFSINHKEESITVYWFDHHDNVYQWRP